MFPLNDEAKVDPIKVTGSNKCYTVTTVTKNKRVPDCSNTLLHYKKIGLSLAFAHATSCFLLLGATFHCSGGAGFLVHGTFFHLSSGAGCMSFFASFHGSRSTRFGRACLFGRSRFLLGNARKRYHQ